MSNGVRPPLALVENVVEVRPGSSPFSLDGAARDPQRFGCIRHGHSTEESALDDAPHTLVVLLQSLEGLLNAQHPRHLRVDNGRIGAKGHLDSATAPLSRRSTSSIVDEDPPHGLGAEGQKLGPTVPDPALDVSQLQVGFVDEGRCIHRMTVGPVEVMVRDTTEVVVHEFHEPVERLVITVAPTTSEAGDHSFVDVRHDAPLFDSRLAEETVTSGPRQEGCSPLLLGQAS